MMDSTMYPTNLRLFRSLLRVRKPGGIASFSEPGRFHSQSPQSQYEMKNYKVLENDIVLTEIFAVAREHGFTELKVRVISDMEVSLDDYQCLTGNRRDPPLEERILKNIRQVISNKTIFFLHKSTFVPDSRSHIGLSCSISTEREVFSAKVGEGLYIPESLQHWACEMA